MSLSSSPGAYTDVKQILDAALAAGGGTYELPDHKQATRWRQRAYRYRSIIMGLKAKELETFPGIAPTTPYDHMFLTTEDNVVIIKFEKPMGLLKTLDGQPIDFKETKANDKLEEEAMAFAATLTGEKG